MFVATLVMAVDCGAYDAEVDVAEVTDVAESRTREGWEPITEGMATAATAKAATARTGPVRKGVPERSTI